MAIKIYHYPRCAKSRKGLKYLQSKTSDIIINDYFKNGLSLEDLNEIILKLNIPPVELIRENEELFREELKGKKFTDTEWLKIIIDNPNLLRRPLIVSKYKAIIGDPPENIDKLF